MGLGELARKFGAAPVYDHLHARCGTLGMIALNSKQLIAHASSAITPTYFKAARLAGRGHYGPLVCLVDNLSDDTD